MKTKITIAVVVIFLIGGAVIAVKSSGQAQTPSGSPGNTSAGSESLNPNATNPTTNPTGSGSAPAGKTYTLSEIATHKDATSCWTTINGNVYDVTSWINQHPGGSAAILSLCGIDGSMAFNNQHGGQRRPANELAGFLIGTLAGAPTSSVTGSGSASAGTVSTGVVSNNKYDDD